MLKLTIKSPDKNIFSNVSVNKEDIDFFVEEIIIDTNDGVIGIKDGHENLISSLPNGELKVLYKDFSNIEKKDIFSIAPGVIVVETKDKITRVDILLEEANNIIESNLEELEKAVKRVEDALKDKDDDIFLSEKLLRDMNKVKVFRRHIK